MLNKELCKKCYSKYYSHYRWTDHDNLRWTIDKIVWCPISKFGSSESNLITDDPPNRCKYKLEHLVLGQNAE